MYSKMIYEARRTDRGNNLLLEIIKAVAVTLAITMAAQTLSSILILILGFYENDTFSNVIFLWGQAFGIGLALLYCRFLEKRSISSVGFYKKSAAKQYAIGIGCGIALFASVLIVGICLGAFKFVGFGKNVNPLLLSLFFVGFLIQGMCEEVLFRGCVMVSIARKNSIPVAVIVNSLLFTLMHGLNTGFGIIPFVNLMLFSVFISLYVLKTDNIWGAGALHGVWNFVQGCIFGLSVSGQELTNPVFVFKNTDMIWANGGTFGPEGGAIVTIVLSIELLTMLYPLFCKKRKTETE